MEIFGPIFPNIVPMEIKLFFKQDLPVLKVNLQREKILLEKVSLK